MDYPAKELMNELGDAVNESLSDSESVAEVMARIKGAGFNVTLVVEASFAHDPSGLREPRPILAAGKEGGLPDPSGLREPRPILAAGKEGGLPALRLTANDEAFLRALKVAATE